MAILNITINTDEKTIQANINGSNLSNVCCVSAYAYEDYMSVRVEQEQDSDGVCTRTTMMFSQSPEAEEAASMGKRIVASEIKDFVVVEEHNEKQLIEDLSKFLGKE